MNLLVTGVFCVSSPNHRQDNICFSKLVQQFQKRVEHSKIYVIWQLTYIHKPTVAFIHSTCLNRSVFILRGTNGKSKCGSIQNFRDISRYFFHSASLCQCLENRRWAEEYFRKEIKTSLSHTIHLPAKPYRDTHSEFNRVNCWACWPWPSKALNFK